jgi:pyruvate/2-oxoglutarate dehydrogenase complex dihydrolipoamide acyltransferase (E2) component
MTQVVPVRMPKLTMAASEATFLDWLVADGERVAAEQPLYVVASDKVESEVPSPGAGVLRHGKAQPETDYPVGAMLGAIEVSESDEH